jgi:hypothetical protein
MDNEAESIPKSLRGTEEGQRICRQRALNNIGIYAEQFGADVDACKSYARSKAFDADGRAVAELTVHGLPVVIETRKGELRTGPGWSQRMAYNYGYLKGQKGADGDSLDVALGPEPESGWVYLFDQRKLPPRQGEFDETKVFLGWSDLDAAVKAFNAGHDRACLVYMDVTPMQVGEFKRWLRDRDSMEPAGGAGARA